MSRRSRLKLDGIPIICGNDFSEAIDSKNS
jgi:hypothetical protein